MPDSAKTKCQFYFGDVQFVYKFFELSEQTVPCVAVCKIKEKKRNVASVK